MKKWNVFFVVLLACGGLQADVIFFDGLNGSPGTGLYGQAPDIDATGSAMWIAQAEWMKNGRLGAGQSCATIPFVPQAGNIYQLTVGLTEMTGDGNWIGVGYAQGTSTASGGNGNRFISAPTAGQPWMLKRADNSANPNQAFYGPGTTGQINISPSLEGEDTFVRIILDTRQPQWVATWQQKTMGTAEFETVATHTYATNPTIGAAGVARSATGVNGIIESLLLETIDQGGATQPFPHDGQKNVTVDTAVLRWNKGSNPAITGHLLYFAEGEPNFITATPIEVADMEDPVEAAIPMTLEMDKTYYWCVKEAAEPNAIQGSIWRFDTLKSIPQIITQPISTAVAAGETAVFKTTFASLSGPTAAWYAYVDGINDQLLTNGGGITTQITQEDDVYTATLSIANAQLANESYYYCVIGNQSGTEIPTASAGLTIKRLLAHYTFDGVLEDQVGTNHATLRNAVDPNSVLNYSSGVLGDAVYLDGAQYLELSTEAFPKPGLAAGIESGTFSCWVQIEAAVETETTVFLIGTHNQSDTSGYQFWLDVSPEDINMRLRTSGAAPHKVAVPEESLIGDGQWRLLTATYEYGGVLQIYLDGSALGAPVACPQLVYTDWEFPMLLGANNNRGTANGFLKGLMDDVRIYNYALTAAEVADLYLEVHPDATFCILEYDDQFDFDGNCRVDLADFARMASGWLSCGSYPDCQ